MEPSAKTLTLKLEQSDAVLHSRGHAFREKTNQSEEHIVMQKKLLSIVVPAYNAARHFSRTLPLLPDDPEIEIIIVANGCTDNTARMALEICPRARIVELPVGSLALARDVGLREARGHYVAFRDADDECLPGSFERLIAELDRRKDLDVVAGNFVFVEHGIETRESDYLTGSDLLFADCLFRTSLHMASSVMRRIRILGLPPCPLYPTAQDWAWLWTAFCQGLQLDTIPDRILRYIRHPASTTATITPGNSLDDLVTILRGQFLAQCGVSLSAHEMMVFVNAAPCIYWDITEVPFIQTLSDANQEIETVFSKIYDQNELIPRDALATRIDQILSNLPTNGVEKVTGNARACSQILDRAPHAHLNCSTYMNT